MTLVKAYGPWHEEEEFSATERQRDVYFVRGQRDPGARGGKGK